MDKKSIIFKILRIVIISIVMCAVVCAIFYAYSKLSQKALEALEEKGNMQNTIWVVENFIPIITIVGIIAALCAIYKLIKIPTLQIQSEKGWIMLIVALFTYGVILPYVINQSRGCFDPVPEGEEDVLSLLEKTVSWFVMAIIPFMISISYHFVKAGKKDNICAKEDLEQTGERGRNAQELNENNESNETNEE